jgi:hypothetical protein
MSLCEEPPGPEPGGFFCVGVHEGADLLAAKSRKCSVHRKRRPLTAAKRGSGKLSASAL